MKDKNIINAQKKNRYKQLISQTLKFFHSSIHLKRPYNLLIKEYKIQGHFFLDYFSHNLD